MSEKEHSLQVQSGGVEFKSQLLKMPNQVLGSSRVLVGDDYSILKEDTYFDNPETLQMHSQMTKQQVQSPSSKDSTVQQVSDINKSTKGKQENNESMSQIGNGSQKQLERKPLNIKTYLVKENKHGQHVDNGNLKHLNGGSPVASCEDLKMITPAGITPRELPRNQQQPRVSPKNLAQKLTISLNSTTSAHVKAIDSETNLDGIVTGKKLLMKSLLYGKGRPKTIKIKGNILQAKYYKTVARYEAVDSSMDKKWVDLRTEQLNTLSGFLKANKESTQHREDTMMLPINDSQQLRSSVQENLPKSDAININELDSGDEKVERNMSDAIVCVSEEEFPAISIMESCSPTRTAYLDDKDLLSGEKLVVLSQETQMMKNVLIKDDHPSGITNQVLTLRLAKGQIDTGSSEGNMVGSESSLAKVPIVQIYKSTYRNVEQDSHHEDFSLIQKSTNEKPAVRKQTEEPPRVYKKSEQEMLTAFLTSPKQMFYNNNNGRLLAAQSRRRAGRNKQMSVTQDFRDVNSELFYQESPSNANVFTQASKVEFTSQRDQLGGGDFKSSLLPGARHYAMNRQLDQCTNFVSQEIDVMALQSQFGINRKNSLISSLVQSQNQTPLPISMMQMRVNRNRNGHFHRTSNLTSSLKDEQIKMDKMLNPWSSVIGGQSRRYFKKKQFKSNLQKQQANYDATHVVSDTSEQRVQTAPNCAGFYRSKRNAQSICENGSLTGWGPSHSSDNRSQSFNQHHRRSSNFQSQIISNFKGSRESQAQFDLNTDKQLATSKDRLEQLQQRRRPRTNQVNCRKRRTVNAPQSGLFNLARTSQPINVEYQPVGSVLKTQVYQLAGHTEEQQRHCSPSTANFQSKTTLNSETKLKQHQTFSCQSEFAKNHLSQMGKNLNLVTAAEQGKRNIGISKLQTPKNDRSCSHSRNRDRSHASSTCKKFEPTNKSPLSNQEKQRKSEQRKLHKPNFFDGKLQLKVTQADNQDIKKSLVSFVKTPQSTNGERGEATLKFVDEKTPSDFSNVATPINMIQSIVKPTGQQAKVQAENEKISQHAKSNTRLHSRRRKSRLTDNLLRSIKNEQRKLSRRLSPSSIVHTSHDEKVLLIVSPSDPGKIGSQLVNERPPPQKKVMPVSEYSFEDNKMYVHRLTEASNRDLVSMSPLASAKQYQHLAPQMKTHLKQHQQFFVGQGIQGQAIKTSLAIPESAFQMSQGTAQLEPISEIASFKQTPFRENLIRKTSQPSVMDDKSSVVGTTFADLIPKYQDCTISPTQFQGNYKDGMRHNKDFKMPSRTNTMPLRDNNFLSQLNSQTKRNSPGLIVSEENIIETTEKGSLHVIKPLEDDDYGFGIENQVGLFTSQAQMHSERSEQQQTAYELTNLKLGSLLNDFNQ